MKYLLTLTSLSLVLFSHHVSATIIPKPEKCPSVAAINAITLQKYHMEHFTNTSGKELWLASLGRNFFDTKNKWSFNTNPFEADNLEVAFEDAKQILSSMHLVRGPYGSSQYDWHCDYQDDKGRLAFASTPTYWD